MKLLMIGHLLGDFYFQTDRVSENKKRSFRYLLLHVLMYIISIYCVMILATGKWLEYIGPMIIIGLGHMAIDYVKIKVENTFEAITKYKLFILALDQMLHIIFLWIFRQMCFFEMNFYWIPEISANLIVIIAILLCGKPAAIVVALVFERIPKTVQNAENTEKENRNECIQSESLKIGSWVGILEREIILLLGLLGQYGAIGFVLAAKSLARHSQLNNQAFAEKYLVGTLLSAFIALLSVVMCSWLK